MANLTPLALHEKCPSAHTPIDLHAMAWDDTHILSAEYSFDQGTLRPMHQLSNALWAAPWDSAEGDDARHTLRVVVTNKSGRTNEDAITIYVDQSGQYVAPPREAGDEINTIGPYLEKGILGTQISPNKNGRKW